MQRHLSAPAVTHLILLLALYATSCTGGAANADGQVRRRVDLCGAEGGCATKSPRIDRIRLLVQSGARAHWAPDSKRVLFDRRGDDGYADVYIADLSGNVSAITAGKSGIGSRNNGNAVFHPSGDFIVFVSEEDRHMFGKNKLIGDPGLGIFCNLWATDPSGSQYWKLTDIPIRRKLFERTPVMATVNPHFNKDGSLLVWTERYGGDQGDWGRWRLKIARFVVRQGEPRLEDERVVFEPTTGNYVTAMGFLDANRLLVSGNLDGQHEFGMDLYSLDWKTGRTANLLDSPESWEEGACVSPDGRRIVFMSNRESPYKLDRKNKDWASQLLEREYYMMRSDGRDLERLTHINDPEAPEYLGGRNMVAVCEFSPNGRYIAGTLGIDTRSDNKRRLELKLILMHLK